MDPEISARRIVTKQLVGKKATDAFASKDVATGRKFYTPSVLGSPTRLAFRKKTLALEYARRIFNRYKRLKEAEIAMKKEVKNV